MAWGFLDWVRGRPYRRDPDKLSLSRRASDAEFRAMALRLLDDRRAFDAYQALEPHPKRARPILEELVRDDGRFRNMSRTVRGWSRPQYDVALTILFEWHSKYAITEALTAAASQDAALRAVAARLLASTGEARFGQTLAALAADADPNVRMAVGHGISHVLEYGDQHDYALDDTLARALYDYLRDCALRTDRGPGHGFAAVLYRLDHDRAARELASDEALTIDRNWLGDLLAAARAAGVVVPPARVNSLLDDAVAIVERQDFDVADHPSIANLIADLLALVAERDPEAASARIRTLRARPQKEAQRAAQTARERLSPDPIPVAIDAHERAGGIEGMRPEHRVVYLVFLLEAEVSNGGWPQWVANSSGAHAGETEAALRAIGADEGAREVRAAMAALGPDGSSLDQGRRMAAIDRMSNSDRSLPDDSVIWEMSTELRALMFDYAERHPDAFPR